MPSLRRLVVPPATLRQVRPRRLLRLLAVTARERPRGGGGAPGRPELRTGRGLVLGLRTRGLRRRSAARPAAPPPARSTGPRSGGPGAAGLAMAVALRARGSAHRTAGR